MSVFESPDYDDHEEVIFVNDRAAGLRSIIAIHSTVRGPALGGCRMYPYSSEADALRDVLRLSRGMSYKAAGADVPLGGGKAVIIGDSRTQKSPALLQAMGRAISRLGGRYITGEDIGTNPRDIAIIRQETDAVSCLSDEDGGYGDPAIFTALGVFQAIRAGLEATRSNDSLQGVRVAVQGVGNVGLHLCSMLRDAGASLVACDTHHRNAERAAALGATVVEPHAIYRASVDVFAPCAIGGVLNEVTIPTLQCTIVAGAANNQLATAEDRLRLHERGIVYVPDYIANGGGLMSCAAEWYRTDRAAVRPRVLSIIDTCREILQESAREGMTPTDVADALASSRLKSGASAPAKRG